jgi:hypothetical protein
MPQLTQSLPNLWAGHVRNVVGRAWRKDISPEKKVEFFLKHHKHFGFKLRSAFRRSRRMGIAINFGPDFEQFENRDQVIAYLVRAALNDRDFFLLIVRDLEIAIDNAISSMRKPKR